jgi:potassium/chloride transporter 9
MPDRKASLTMAMDAKKGGGKLGIASGVYIPVCLSILSILMFLRFGIILGEIGLLGMLGLITLAYCVDLLTTLSLSAIASNGEVKGGGAYYLISRSLGPEFGGSIGILFFLAQVWNSSMNIVGLIDCIRLHFGPRFPQHVWAVYGLESAALALCTCLCLLGSAMFSKASNGLLVILSLAIISIPISALFQQPFYDPVQEVEFTGFSLTTLAYNFMPHVQDGNYRGVETFRSLFGILFSATSGIFAGASMSGDLRSPSKAIPKGTLWAMITTFIIYNVVVFSLAATTTRSSLLANSNIIVATSLFKPVIVAGECAVTFFSALMGLTGGSKLFQVLARDKLLPGLEMFGKGTGRNDDPILAVLLTYLLAQLSLFADLNQIATMISMGYLMTFLVMNLACFLLKIGSAPNFRPSFKFFNWQTAGLGSILSAVAMFFMDGTYAAIAICVLVCLFLLIHYLSPPKHWGDVSQNLIYHQVRKYLLRLRPEHIKFWRPQIILLINNPRKQTRLIQFCNSLKKGSLYILGHVIVTDDFSAGVQESRVQQQAWSNYISETSRIKAFLQLTMSPSVNWGIRNLILSAGLGGMRPNIAVLGFYNMNELRGSRPKMRIPEVPASPTTKMQRPEPASRSKKMRPRSDTSSRILASTLPTDVIRTEGMMSPTEYMTALEDLTLIYRLNVAVGYGFDMLETPVKDGINTKKYIDLWPIQMSAEVSADGKNVLTTNFDTYTLILQLGHILHSVRTWGKAYKVRVMVFVEYESEVEEEQARVKALLDKLRIDAEVVVFWLASGELNTYELIVNGVGNDIDWEIITNDTLKDDDWWDELQMFRGRPENITPAREMEQAAHVIGSTVGRTGVFNPHEEPIHSRRRQSMVERNQLFGDSSIAFLRRAGVSMGIHTHHLNDDVLQEAISDDELESDTENSELDQEDIGYHFGRTMANDSIISPLQRPLLSQLYRNSTRRIKRSDNTLDPDENTDYDIFGSASTIRASYGTMAQAQARGNPRSSRERLNTGTSLPRIPQITENSPSPGQREQMSNSYGPEEFPDLATSFRDVDSPFQQGQPRSRVSPRAVSRTPSNPDGSQQHLGRAPVSRSTSALVQSAARLLSVETPSGQATPDQLGGGNSQDTDTAKGNRPSFSRQSSLGRFSSRPVPETKVHDEDDQLRTISFAAQPDHNPRSAAHSRHHSRQGSQRSTFGGGGGGGGDTVLTIPELLESYRHDSRSAEQMDGGSTYSTQGIALSFNDLPSRAQHLILNELLRQNSKDTAVILTTLPIPSEGTSLDEAASIQYLSDVEILCNELPPTLMVLSNNMTVTVSL